MDAFFASIEVRRNPALAGKPVVVGGSGDPRRRGVVSTASYEARKFGIRSAMPLITALRLCPHCIFLPVDYEEYMRVSKIIKNILSSFSPVMEDVGIDEAYLDIWAVTGDPLEIAVLIKREIKEATGLTCSIGIAPNKLLAKIGSDLQKPDGLTVIGEDNAETILAPLPVRKLPGIGPKMEAYLEKNGILTIGQLAAISGERLREMFGKSYGEYIYEASRGIHESPLITHWEAKSISREETFEWDTDSWQDVARTLVMLLREVVGSMKEQEMLARTVTVKIRLSDFSTYTRAKTFPVETDSLEILRGYAFECLKRIELGMPVRLVGVRVSKLSRKGAEAPAQRLHYEQLTLPEVL